MAKKNATYLIDSDTLKEFNNIAEDNSINKSNWIEKQMKQFIRDRKKV